MSLIPNIPNLLEFLGSLSQWDIPLYKKLTKTDLGLKGSNGKKSNQGGPLIPVKFIDYMPQFPEPVDPLASDSIDINLELWNEKFYWGQSRSKFLYETRNLQRSREYRITTNIKQWLSKAEDGDFIIIQKKSY
ncbi:hypothetical protein [Oceanimonas baumannii]|uniref:Uncharacterized protein n=1 Tax=Oceanimonas baumannii TaxID=129578 RepID=A0A235CN81_9GAMM|nr:hypothetical protein [Oceanimonas baumannii]OYD26038.1 hypothetical protein B6S09_00150 [Oceanimonas baumannii]TDW62319.1 hypothetical protein LY04_00381 [Oceanimonas baumannii]